jgi:predicted Zn-dependent protease
MAGSPPDKPKRPWARRAALAGLLLLVLGIPAGVAGWYLHAESHLRAAERALERRDYADAHQHLAKYLEARPNSARAHFLAARVARIGRRYDEAEEHLRVCRERGWDEQALDVERRLRDLQEGDASAEPFLRQRAEAGGPDTLPILEVLTQFYIDGYGLTQALVCLKLYLAERPDDLRALLGRAYVWERFQYYGDAADDYRRAVAAHPDSAEARLRLADTLLLAGTPQEALPHYEWLESHGPARSEVRLGAARCRRRLGQAEEARRSLDAQLAERPNDPAVLSERGQLALDEGRADDAEAWLRKAVQIAPHDRKANYSLAQCLRVLNRPDEARPFDERVKRIDADLKRIDQLSKAVIRAPNDPALRVEAAALFLRNGEEREGVRWLQLALRLDPAHRAAHEALADYYGRSGQAALAARHRRLAGGTAERRPGS